MGVPWGLYGDSKFQSFKDTKIQRLRFRDYNAPNKGVLPPVRKVSGSTMGVVCGISGVYMGVDCGMTGVRVSLESA